MDFDVAQGVQSQIRGLSQAPASSLQHVSEMDGDSTEDSLQKLQLQVFALTDALVAAVEEIERLRQRR